MHYSLHFVDVISLLNAIYEKKKVPFSVLCRFYGRCDNLFPSLTSSAIFSHLRNLYTIQSNTYHKERIVLSFERELCDKKVTWKSRCFYVYRITAHIWAFHYTHQCVGIVVLPPSLVLCSLHHFAAHASATCSLLKDIYVVLILRCGGLYYSIIFDRIHLLQ